MSFSRLTAGPVVLWQGDPDSSAAEGALLDWLREELGAAFRTDPLNERVFGNLGECLAHMLGLRSDFADWHSIVANAVQPLANVSASGIDVLWFFPAPDATDDMAVVQEVKTTSNASLALADDLVDDTAKLFGEDVQVTLQTRLNAAAADFKLTRRRPDLAARIRQLGATDAQTATQVRLCPTIIHEEGGANPQTKLTAIRTSIVSLGWDGNGVVPWSVAIEDIWNRFERVSRGQS